MSDWYTEILEAMTRVEYALGDVRGAAYRGNRYEAPMPAGTASERVELAKIIESRQGHLGGTDAAIIADDILASGFRRGGARAKPLTEERLATLLTRVFSERGPIWTGAAIAGTFGAQPEYHADEAIEIAADVFHALSTVATAEQIGGPRCTVEGCNGSDALDDGRPHPRRGTR